jgi:uncharacterized protein YcgL (UPF0745 family)
VGVVCQHPLSFSIANDWPANTGFYMFCYIYRSNRKVDTYLYLAEKDDFSILPEEMLKIFGDPEFSFSFELSKDKKLAIEDAGGVLDNLQSQGYHLQLQSDVLIEQMLTRKATN